MERFPSATSVVFLGLCVLTIIADVVQGVRLIQENGFKLNSHYYHLGDGGHAYHINSETGSSVYFKCVLYERGCRGRAILKIGGAFRHTKEHNHAPDPDFVGERHFRENVLHRIRQARFVSFQDVLNQARRDRRYSRRVRSKMTLRRLASAMSRARTERYPRIPLTLAELTRQLLTDNSVAKTIDESENLYAGSVTAGDGSHHVAFFSPRMLELLANLKTIQGDGTFKARPSVPKSSQCFVIVTTWRNAVVPVGWILMERRTLSAYQAVFQLLKSICPRLNPDVIISDWEYAQQRAWSEAFPNAQIQGCLWHLCRAFIKKARKLGLMRFRKLVSGLFSTVRKCCILSLLPTQYFQNGLDIIKAEALERDVLIAYLLRDFFIYVEDRWINNPRRNEWMAFYRCMHRTNNSCEAHNRMLRKEVGAHRPNVFLFIEALARLEHNAMLDVFHMEQGGNARRARKWQSVFQDRQIEALCDDLELDIHRHRDRTLSNFMLRASDLVYGTFQNLVNHEAAEL